MRFLYQAGIELYWIIAHLLSPFKPKIHLFIKGRRHWRKKLSSLVDSNSKYIWIHCASLGEFEQGRPIIEKLKKENPNNKICLTFFSPSGYEIRKNYELADLVFYLPKDSYSNAKYFVKTLNPSIAIFIKYEFWFHFLERLNNEKIPTYLVSAIFRSKQIFFKPYGRFFRKMLHSYNMIFIQDEESGEHLKSININNFQLNGDTRFDRVWEITRESFESEIIINFLSSGNKCIVAGSTWPQDEELLVEIIKEHKDIKFIIAPHEINDSHIDQLKSLLNGIDFKLYSHGNLNETENARVLIIDTIGILSKIYRYANIAYIGGGFGKGIHNTLEAACYGIPVVFGPKYLKFREAIELIEHKAGFSINNISSLKSIINILLDSEQNSIAGENAINYVKNKCGATNNFIKHLKKNDVF
jgi:3-deoxy-D-manno-octulosonic-acid transferase